jgi:drug/metabolite transporter (DMT)-like permease
MAVVLGLAAALAYGVSDFVAGLLSRRRSFVLVAVVAHAAGCSLLLIALVLTGPRAPTAGALLWGAASGVGSALGTLALYRGLGRGRMGVVAPLSALCAAVLPVIVGVLAGERPSPLAWFGVALAFPAIWLVSALDTPAGPERLAGPPAPAGAATAHNPGPATPASRLASGIGDGLLAGVAFALLFVALARAGDGSGLWPPAVGSATALAILLIFGVGQVRRLRRGDLPRHVVAGAATAGLAGSIATVLYFFSTHAGLLAIVAVVTSLYPGFTVLLAALVLRERIGVMQGAGLALAALAVILVVGG